MSSHLSTRLARLEASQTSGNQELGIGWLEYRDGRLTKLALCGTRFERGDETARELKDRAIAALGPFDQVLWVSWAGKTEAEEA